MTGRLFWMFSFLLMTVIVHISLVLFVPKFAADDIVTELEANARPQQFSIIKTRAERVLQIDGDSSLVHAICMFDMKSGPVELDVPLPNGYWSITVYRPSGDAVYTINDRQLDADRLRLIVKPAEENDEFVGDPTFAEIDSALQVSIGASRRGFAVLRALAPYAANRPQSEAILVQGRCAPYQSSTASSS